MKTLILLSATSLFSIFGSNPIDDDCTCKGFKLYGKIKIVENFPDVTIKYVDNFPGKP